MRERRWSPKDKGERNCKEPLMSHQIVPECRTKGGNVLKRLQRTNGAGPKGYQPHGGTWDTSV